VEREKNCKGDWKRAEIEEKEKNTKHSDHNNKQPLTESLANPVLFHSRA
jgi:hypothetical protein